jgi:hypothetical protein
MKIQLVGLPTEESNGEWLVLSCIVLSMRLFAYPKAANLQFLCALKPSALKTSYTIAALISANAHRTSFQ